VLLCVHMKDFKILLNRLSDNAKTSLVYAREIAFKLGSKEITSSHLFASIIINKNSLVARTLSSIGFEREKLLSELFSGVDIGFTKLDRRFDGTFVFSSDTKDILQEAYVISSKMAHVYVGTEHLFLALLANKNFKALDLLKKYNLTEKKFRDQLMSFAVYPPGVLSQPEMKPMHQSQEAHLSMLGHDLIAEAIAGAFDPLVGRDDELRQMINILSRRRKNNPVIVGEPGVGKTALVEGLAQMLAKGDVPGSLHGMRLIELDIPALMAGSKLRGDIEEKMMAIIAEAVTSSDVILFIDEIHNILGSNIPGIGLDIAAVLKPALVRDDFRVVGATTSDEYTRFFEEDNALVRRFQPLMLEEPSVDETIEILHRVEPLLEEHHNVDITKEAIEAAVKLSSRYVVDRFLPDKAIDLLDEAAASKKLDLDVRYGESVKVEKKLDKAILSKEKAVLRGDMEGANKWSEAEGKHISELKKIEGKKSRSRKAKKYIVDLAAIQSVVSKWTGIPLSTVSSREYDTLLGLDKSIRSRVVGQDDAIEIVANSVRRARAGISDAERPWASLLFLGPTGVGKTELAKALTIELFGDEDRLIQIDMSEMMERHSISKLVGSPPGYVGYRDGGQLTERVRKNPHTVILFDEIEKAHPDVLNILLQILEYGHLTDGKGRKINFKNTIVLLTSNIGAEEISRDKVLGFAGEGKQHLSDDIEEVLIGEAYDSMKADLMKELKSKLRPELLNRLDDVVIFRSLSKDDAKIIINILIEDLNKRLAGRSLAVELTNAALDAVVNEGFSKEYGARPLRRVIQGKVESLVAEFILSKKGRDFDEEKVVIDVDKKGAFKVKKTKK
jgi:ATP-dependent Clp protease ATP-binding subunit ClpC